MPTITHKPLFVAKQALGKTRYFTSRDAFEYWLENFEHPNTFLQINEQENEYRVFETMNHNTSSIARWRLTETFVAALDLSEDDL